MRKLLSVVVLVGTVLGFWLYGERPVSFPESITQNPVAVEPTNEGVRKETADRRSPEKSVVALAPTLENVRQEVEKNPHAPAESLLRFAGDLAPKMEEAQKSDAAAEKFFFELQECVASPELRENMTARALCLMNIRRLGQKVPALKIRADTEIDKADPELLRLAQ